MRCPACPCTYQPKHCNLGWQPCVHLDLSMISCVCHQAVHLQNKWVETRGSVCLQQCQRPPDGGVCTLDAACSKGSLNDKHSFLARVI